MSGHWPRKYRQQYINASVNTVVDHVIFSLWTSTMRAVITTHESIGGMPRKLAWFARHGKGLYFDIGSSFYGSHTSYHVDGNIFRTSPATGLRPRFQGKYMPLD